MQRRKFLASLGAMALANISKTARKPSFAAPMPEAVPGDRWMEIDLYWFQQDRIQTSVNEFWNRFASLYQGIQGYRGVILNVGWTVEYIMDWSGDLSQRIVLPMVSGQQPWVAETGPLSGDWQQMHEEWQRRFARPVNVPRHGYGPWTYGDLKKLAVALRETGARHGVPDLKVGSLTLAWEKAYGQVAPWATRHPEAFGLGELGEIRGAFIARTVFNPGALLHADPHRLGGLPNGIPEGVPAGEAFAAQWGSLSKAVGLEAIMLRDSFGMPVPYRRGGPFGPLCPNPEIARRWTAVVAALVRETKRANPKALVMMYSNAASAVADWCSNCCDLESIAEEGHLDIFVDQTWAGAWNEVGVRNDDFWNNPMLGWTYQLAYTLVHAAVLAETKVRHYPLVETFDAWESWDVIHTVPERLRWGIWAYSHAAVKTPRGLKMPAGSYISWANQGKRLLNEAAVHFLATNINAAVTDAHRTQEVFGPTLVYSREAMSWQMEHAPDRDIKEWIDEQVGSAIKWPIPVLSSTRSEWLPEVNSDLFILQAPVHLSPKLTSYIATLIEEGHPIAIFASPAGGIDPGLMRLAGLDTAQVVNPEAEPRAATLSPAAELYIANVPISFPTRTWLTKVSFEVGASPLYLVEGSPALELDTQAGRRIAIWNPPSFAYDHKPLLDLWGGSPAAPAIAAGVLNFLISTPKTLHAAKIDMNQTLNVSAWRAADGCIRLLAANLEEGVRDNADRSRHAVLVMPTAWKVTELLNEWSGQRLPVRNNQILIALGHVSSALLAANCHS